MPGEVNGSWSARDRKQGPLNDEDQLPKTSNLKTLTMKAPKKRSPKLRGAGSSQATESKINPKRQNISTQRLVSCMSRRKATATSQSDFYDYSATSGKGTANTKQVVTAKRHNNCPFPKPTGRHVSFIQASALENYVEFRLL